MEYSYKKIKEDLSSINNLKTKQIDDYNKMLIKNNVDVSFLKDYVLKDNLVHRTYFQVSLAYFKTYQEQLTFIEENADFLQDWWHVDQLTQFIIKPLDFNYVYKLAKKYVNSKDIFLRRWGYVIFLIGLQKDEKNTLKILKLLKDDSEYYVSMAQAWLICDLAVYNPKVVLNYIENSKLKYNILGKAIQKICDSFRISNENKNYAKSLRNKVKNN